MKLKFLGSDIDRFGTRRWFVRAGERRHRRKIRIPMGPGAPGFLQAYETAMTRLANPADRSNGAQVRPGTMRWLATQYFGSPEFAGFVPKSQVFRRQIIESCLHEPLVPGGSHLVADCPLAKFSSRHVQMLRDRKAKTPGAANNRKKFLSAMFGWAIEDKETGIQTNPCREVRKLAYESDGFKLWTEADLDRFESFYPVGSKPRLALALLLLTGARRSDVVGLGPANVRDGWLRFVPVKTRKTRKDATPKPWLPELAHIVAATKLQGRDTFLVTDYGKPFTAKGFGNWFSKKCLDAGLADCSAHGLRKLGATRAAENGATHLQLMALFDWSSVAQAQHYVQHAERKRATGDTMHMLAKRGTR
jgi:integrase